MNLYKAVHRDVAGRFVSDVASMEYKVGDTYEALPGTPGFHACSVALACFVVYDFDADADALLEVRLESGLSTDGIQCVGNRMTVLREVPEEEKRRLLSGRHVIFSPQAGTEWYLDGQLHREGDLPAVITSLGDCEWWVHGKRHREGGYPAVLRHDGYMECWENGVRVSPVPCGHGGGSEEYFSMQRV